MVVLQLNRSKYSRNLIEIMFCMGDSGTLFAKYFNKIP